MTLEVLVYGIAQPKGSMRAFAARGMKFPIVTDSNRSARSWSQLVAVAASARLVELGTLFRPMTGAVRMVIAFTLPRPKAIKNKSVAHLKKPDVDKLSRSVLDALTGVVFRDDSQVVYLHAMKRYAAVDESPHTRILITDVVGDPSLDFPENSKC